MSTYYVDPAASGSNNGSSWTNAWTSLQSAADTAVAGDTVYCRGTQTIAATIDFDTNSGTNTGGYIKFIGCNASGTVDGTKFGLTSDSGAFHAVTVAAAIDLFWIENFEIYNFDGSNGSGGAWGSWNAGRGCVFINCSFHSNEYGVNAIGYGSTIIRCAFNNNTWNGASGSEFCFFLFCSFCNNTSSGFYGQGTHCYFIGCLFHGNNNGIGLNQGVLFNCVIDGNTSKGILSYAHTDFYNLRVFGCRITNHSGSGDIGIDAASELLLTGWNYLENNADANIQNASLHYAVPSEGGSASSNIEDASSVTNAGYVDPTNHDFSTNYDATDPDNIRRTTITIPYS